jgi:signal transduction histidine kinase
MPTSLLESALNVDAQRLRALERYNILDTDPEFAFDDLTRLASLVCQTPISLIGLMDHHRQWLKSRTGLPTGISEIPRELAFCNEIVMSGSPLEVSDLQTDPRFAENPFVAGDMGLRFYAGVPLKTADNITLGTVCVIDHQPRELTEAQLQALTTIAEQVMAQLELKLRNKQLETGYDRLFRANRRLDQFTTMVSQDLKAPLSSLLGLADLMLGDARQGDADAVCEALSVMSGEVSRMQRLVTGLLEFSRATRPSTQIEQIDVASMLHELRLTLPGAANYEFVIGQQPIFFTAAAPLRQVFSQLLLNAIQHHPERFGRIEIQAEAGPNLNQLTFRVTDNGSGIPEADRERVFQLFQRLAPAGQGSPGSGIGLAVVKHLVEDFGGRIQLEAAPNGPGTSVVFTWEQAEDPAPTV